MQLDILVQIAATNAFIEIDIMLSYVFIGARKPVLIFDIYVMVAYNIAQSAFRNKCCYIGFCTREFSYSQNNYMLYWI